MLGTRSKSLAPRDFQAVTALDDEAAFRRAVDLNTEASSCPANKPSPLNFEAFIPWVCAQWCASTAVIVTASQSVKYAREEPRGKGGRGRSKKIVTTTQTDLGITMSVILKAINEDQIIPINAFYDYKQQLVEISIIGCPIAMSRKVIHALSLCIPFHGTLNRITISKGHALTDEIIYEINKLLPISNITEICFDDSNVKEGNYYILLEQHSQLRYLSLNRCRINDAICKKIFKNLEFGANGATMLKSLELGSNQITDVGASFIGYVLQKNRCLTHLNLSGNRITDIGFLDILYALKEFPLTDDENAAMKSRRILYYQSKVEVYKRCFEQLMSRRADDVDSNRSSKKKMSFNLKRSRKKNQNVNAKTTSDTATPAKSVLDVAEAMAKGIVGDFIDPFAPKNLVTTEDNAIHCVGNFALSYINMAYNNLTYPSIKVLAQVIKYQHDLDKPVTDIGLMRVTLDGNYIPETCLELEEIDWYIKKIMNMRTPTSKKHLSLAQVKLASKFRIKSQTSFKSQYSIFKD